MSAECLESPGLLLLHLQAGNWLCHLPKAWRGLQEQDCLVQMRLRALSVSPLRSSREKPSRVLSCLTPPRRVKETSLHVRSCHGALLQCGGGVCKKRCMRGSAGGRGLFPPRAALCRQPGRSTERLLAEASRQIEKQPHAGTFYVHLL